MRTAAALAALLLFGAPPAAAQPTGALEGSVSDSGGGALPGVTVTLSGPPAAGAPLLVTGADGRFSAAMLPAGDYVLAVVLPGFEAQEIAVTVAAGETVSLQVVMEIEHRMESITVVAEAPRIFATNVVAEPMIAQQSTATSVLAVVDNLPGVSIQEGDAFGTDDWSTSVSMRGFHVHLDEAQIGTTIDGFPNGTSDYWSGSKANRFIDTMNMGGVEVSQGTADVASRSIEALGGTFDFTTDDPERERTYTVALDVRGARGAALLPALRHRRPVRHRNVRLGLGLRGRRARTGCRAARSTSATTSPPSSRRRSGAPTCRPTSRTTTRTRQPTSACSRRPTTRSTPAGTA